ncbi:MAG: hypothetical protein KDD99_08490 [Bacteroidetes bacterium]|nr:hypothetical protein [Bacteroidota bacterium]
MEDNNELYFIPMPTQDPNIPYLDWHEDEDDSIFFDGDPVKVKSPISLILGEPEPHKPNMVDYHTLPEPVVSDKIKNILESLEISGIQYIPAKIQVGKEMLDYWYLYINNRIGDCIDIAKSNLDIDEDGDIMGIEKIILDNDKINKIPLANRLVFKFREFNLYEVFHKSLVDEIMAHAPEGIKFWSLLEWDKSTYFK